jgi:hypothetical protein
MYVALTLLGVALIAVGLWDVFQTLFHPAGRGAMSDQTANAVWKFFRFIAKRYKRALTYAGPTATLAIMMSWVALIWIGFALIYLPRMGTGFIYGQGVDQSKHGGLIGGLVVSLGGLMTNSEGVEAKEPWLEFTRGIEAVLGFGLLTASVSWLLSVYPVLEMRRSIAMRATLLHHAELSNDIDIVREAPQEAQSWIFSLGCDLASLRNQMTQFPITYYFYVGEPNTSLAGALPYVDELARRAATKSSSPALHVAGTILGGAVHDFLETLAEEFLHIGKSDKQNILRAYASEQMADMLFLERTVTYPRKT